MSSVWCWSAAAATVWFLVVASSSIFQEIHGAPTTYYKYKGRDMKNDLAEKRHKVQAIVEYRLQLNEIERKISEATSSSEKTKLVGDKLKIREALVKEEMALAELNANRITAKTAAEEKSEESNPIAAKRKESEENSAESAAEVDEKDVETDLTEKHDRLVQAIVGYRIQLGVIERKIGEATLSSERTKLIGDKLKIVRALVADGMALDHLYPERNADSDRPTAKTTADEESSSNSASEEKESEESRSKSEERESEESRSKSEEKESEESRSKSEEKESEESRSNSASEEKESEESRSNSASEEKESEESRSKSEEKESEESRSNSASEEKETTNTRQTVVEKDLAEIRHKTQAVVGYRLQLGELDRRIKEATSVWEKKKLVGNKLKIVQSLATDAKTLDQLYEQLSEDRHTE